MIFRLVVLLLSGIVLGSPSGGDAFIDATFRLQDAYSRVLCVSGDDTCPAEVTVSVPCLTDACVPGPAAYPVADTFSTIQAAADAAQPGDLVIITPGRYRGVALEESGGADGAYIHFLGWGEPGSVIVDQPADPDKDYLRHHFYFIDTHYFIVQNLAFEGAEGAGLFVSGYFSETGHFAHHIIVLDVYSHDNGTWGLHTTATSQILIQDSVFAASGEEHGVYISGSGDDVLIRRNVFQGNQASGVQVNADPQTAAWELLGWLDTSTGDTCGLDDTGALTWDAVWDCYAGQGLPDLYPLIEDGRSENVRIEQNVITGNGAAGGAGINLASVSASVVQNNLVYGNAAAGIACWDNGYAEKLGLSASTFGCHGVEILNNTLVDRSGGRGSLILNQDASDMVVMNNIIVRGDRSDAYEVTGRSAQGLRSAFNAYSAQSVEDWPSATQIDSDPSSRSVTGFSVDEALSQFAAPNFNPWLLLDGPWPVPNPDRPDYHLRPGSEWAMRANPAVGPDADLNGDARSRVEIGALTVAAEANRGVWMARMIQPAEPGVILYRLPDGTQFMIRPGDDPQDLTPALDALGSGSEDEWLTISPDGQQFLISTDRFDSECAGWPCLAVLSADLAAAEAVRADGAAVHPEGFGAIASGGDRIVYPQGGGPHAVDLWLIERDGDAWGAPLLLTADSPYDWNQQPAFSADGTRVLFDCGSEPYGAEGTAICEVGPDGFRVVITPDDAPPGMDAAGVALHHADYALSLDTTEDAIDAFIVFESNWGGGERIWRTPRESVAPELVAPDYGNDNSPCALSDGRIASLWLNREGGPGYHELKIMNPDGSDPVLLVIDIDIEDSGLGCGG